MAQEAFAREPLEARSAVLERVAHALVEDADAITRTIVSEAGKPLAEAYAHELVVGADACRWLAANLGRVLREERLGFPQLVLRQKRGWIRYEPLGVVGIVTPWNFPLAIPLREVAAAVAAGNAAVLKPSELTPLTGAWVEELFRRAGAPAGPRSRRAGPRRDHGRRRSSATAASTRSCSRARSRSAGAWRRRPPSGCARSCSSSAGRTRCSCSTTPTSTAPSQGALWGTFTNCGQACAGIERIAVPPGLHDAFVERLTAASPRPPHRARARTPTSSSGRSSARCSGTVREPRRGRGRARGDGRGRRPPARTSASRAGSTSPTILARRAADARLRGEELFGPAPSLSRWTTRRRWCAGRTRRRSGSARASGRATAPRARAVAARLETGSVWHNDHAYSFGASQAPWGGRRASGLGRTGSRHGLYALSHVKLVDADRGRLTPGWWFPYGDAAVDGLARPARRPLRRRRRRRAPGRWPCTGAASPISRGRRCGERPLARRRGDRRGTDGRRRRQAADAPSRGRAGTGADGARRPPRASHAAEGRRAHGRPDRRHPGGEADGRPDPALPPAPADGGRGRARGRRGRASRSRRPPRRPRRRASRWRR